MLPRLKFVLLLFALVGVGTLFLHSRQYEEKTEAWMEEAVPERVPGYNYTTSSRVDSSVKMDQLTYDTLVPFGIVVRNFTSPEDGRRYEFVLIAGNTRKSFHDPVVCFSAQNWVLEGAKKRKVNIPALGGDIYVTAMGLHRPEIRGAAMYFYKSPFGWRDSPWNMPIDLTLAKLMLKDRTDAAFFRFVIEPATEPAGQDQAAIEEALQKDIDKMANFANAMITELKKTDEGKFFVTTN